MNRTSAATQRRIVTPPVRVENHYDIPVEEYRRRMGLDSGFDPSPLELQWSSIWYLYARDMPVPVPQHYFARPQNEYRFDFCWPEAWLAVEIDGGVNAPGGGHHGQDPDRIKLNLATELGWSYYRFSGAMIKTAPLKYVSQVARTLVARGVKAVAP